MKDYDIALKNFLMKKASQIITILHDIDVKSKGVEANTLSQSDFTERNVMQNF